MTYSEDAWKNKLDKFVPEEIEKEFIGDCVAYSSLKAFLLVKNYNVNPKDIKIYYLKGNRDLDALWEKGKWKASTKNYNSISNHMTISYKDKILDYKFHDSIDEFRKFIKETEEIDYEIVEINSWEKEEIKLRKIAKLNKSAIKNDNKKLTDEELKKKLKMVADLNNMTFVEFVLFNYGEEKGKIVLERLESIK